MCVAGSFLTCTYFWEAQYNSAFEVNSSAYITTFRFFFLRWHMQNKTRKLWIATGVDFTIMSEFGRPFCLVALVTCPCFLCFIPCGYPGTNSCSSTCDKWLVGALVLWVSMCEHSVAPLCLTLCDPMDCSLPGFSVLGISQARILEWVAVSYSRGSSQARDWTCTSCVFCITDGFFTIESPRKPLVSKWIRLKTKRQWHQPSATISLL